MLWQIECMITRFFLYCFLLIVALPQVVYAQQSGRVHVIGSLAFGATNPNDPIYDELRKGLGELGWVDGRDFRIEHRTAEGHLDRLLPLATELTRLNVDAIVTGNDESTRAARQATSSIPIVAL